VVLDKVPINLGEFESDDQSLQCQIGHDFHAGRKSVGEMLTKEHPRCQNQTGRLDSREADCGTETVLFIQVEA
jgi:hypothetical protein